MKDARNACCPTDKERKTRAKAGQSVHKYAQCRRQTKEPISCKWRSRNKTAVSLVHCSTAMPHRLQPRISTQQADNPCCPCTHCATMWDTSAAFSYTASNVCVPQMLTSTSKQCRSLLTRKQALWHACSGTKWGSMPQKMQLGCMLNTQTNQLPQANTGIATLIPPTPHPSPCA